MAIPESVMVEYARLLGEHTARLDVVNTALSEIKDELRALRAVVMPRRILQISLAGGASTAVLVSAVLNYLQG